MQTTIQVKKVYRQEGTSKAGKPYVLTKLLDSSHKYYTTFKSDSTINALADGMQVTLEYEVDEGRPNTFSITKIISYEASTVPSSHGVGKQGTGEPTIQSPANPSGSPISVEARLHQAKQLALKECPEFAEMSEFPYLIATILNELGSDERQRIMVEQDAVKIRAYGKGN